MTKNKMWPAVAVLVLLAASCAPVIVSFAPEEGPVGTEVRITGRNFKDTAAGNTVKFGSVLATAVSMDGPNTIKASVPAGAVTAQISVTTSRGTGTSEKNFIVPTPAKWTFMVYLDGDNNLEQDGLNDFMEMSSVGSSAALNIVVQMDRTEGHAAGYGDWKDTRRFLVTPGLTPAAAPVEDLDERNMGDPAVLKDFVVWAVTHYPAEHYALSIWNHGGGWRKTQEDRAEIVKAAKRAGGAAADIYRTVCTDDTNGDVLYMREVQDALASARGLVEERIGTKVKLDVVGFDACLMGMVEVAYALRDAAQYMVGSEMVEPGAGWPYDAILGALAAAPTMTPATLAGRIVTEYADSYPGQSDITQAAVDLGAVAGLAAKVDAFTAKAASEWDKLKAARSNSIAYHLSYIPDSLWGVDLWDFADEAYNRVTSADIKAAALDLRNAVTAFVISERHSADMAGSHGTAIYFPATLTIYNNDPDHGGYEDSNTFMPVDFVKYHSWDNWLKTFYSHIP